MEQKSSRRNQLLFLDDPKGVAQGLAKGADPNFVISEGNKNLLCPLSYCIFKKFKKVVDIVRLLLQDNRTNVNATDIDGFTALHYCCGALGPNDNDALKIVELLLEHPKIDVNLRNKFQGTALYYACSRNKIAVLNLIIDDNRADPNIGHQSGTPPLHVCAERNFPECVKVLVKSDQLDINATFSGQTALELAYEKGFKLVVTEILKNENTNAAVTNKEGELVLDKILKDESVLKGLGENFSDLSLQKCIEIIEKQPFSDINGYRGIALKGLMEFFGCSKETVLFVLREGFKNETLTSDGLNLEKTYPEELIIYVTTERFTPANLAI